MTSIPRAPGIYQILCAATGKIYIGSSKNLYARRNDHWSALRRGKHKNRHLQSAWNKHGEAEFLFSVIELVPCSFIVEREQYWIDKLKACNRHLGFNQAPKAQSNAGVVHSEQSRRNMSAARKGKTFGPMSDAARRALSDAKRGKKYKPHSAEARAAKAERQRGRGISQATRQKISDARKGKPPSDATRAASRLASSYMWVVIDPDGNETAVVGLETFCRERGLIAQSLRGVARGKYRQHKGWKCRLAS